MKQTVTTNNTSKHSAPPVIDIRDVTKTYQMGSVQVHALHGVSLTIAASEYVAIVGASGSGKSTLMNIIGLLDRPTSGSYAVNGVEVAQLSENRLADLRNREIGFVFQRFHLPPRCGARQQMELLSFTLACPGASPNAVRWRHWRKWGWATASIIGPTNCPAGGSSAWRLRAPWSHSPAFCSSIGALDSQTGKFATAFFSPLRRVAQFHNLYSPFGKESSMLTPEEVIALARRIGEKLTQRRLMAATAESCTGGLIGHLITENAGSSLYFAGAAVVYSYAAKERLLGVDHDTLLHEGAVSAQVAQQMAQGALRLFGVDVAVSVTGIAGPGGALPGKPTGATYLHLSAVDGYERGAYFVWDGDRSQNKLQSAHAALQMLLDYVDGVE
ncbi:MAG: nicotinamide-nucleotide amidohydrolase family protein [Caldilinea sp.]|nr:nicotinamide-nucleotide amidohydrolase family protein [Caldilinea sp.]